MEETINRVFADRAEKYGGRLAIAKKKERPMGEGLLAGALWESLHENDPVLFLRLSQGKSPAEQAAAFARERKIVVDHPRYLLDSTFFWFPHG